MHKRGKALHHWRAPRTDNMANASLLLLVVIGVCAVACGEEAGGGPLLEWRKNTEEFLKKFSDEVNAIASSPNADKLKNTLKESSDSFLKQMSTLSGNLQNALKDAEGEAKTALEKVHADLEKSRSELEKRHPGVKASAEDLRKNLQESMQKVLEPTKALATELQASAQATGDKLMPHLKDAYDKFIVEAQNVQTKLREAAAKHE